MKKIIIMILVTLISISGISALNASNRVVASNSVYSVAYQDYYFTATKAYQTVTYYRYGNSTSTLCMRTCVKSKKNREYAYAGFKVMRWNTSPHAHSYAIAN